MSTEKLHKHYFDFETQLKRAKKEFDLKWRQDFQPNASLTEFKLLRTLGTGSFGRVMKVRHKSSSEEIYAMKIMEKAHIVRNKQVRHTISEVRIMDAVRFHFLVYLEYFFKDNVYLFLVMPFINGGEMFSHLREMRKFEENLSKFYAAQVILAFEYLHCLGMVYRDLKPENILIDLNGYIKITDYGFCKKVDEQRTYTLCGTPEYLAPEIILSQGYNKSVDWWSLGILIYEMNAGYPPFYAREPMKIYEKIVSGKYQTPQHFSKALRDLISNMLQVDRTKRYGILKGGSKDVKGHEWFRSFDWDGVLGQKVKPIFKPQVKGMEDSTNFAFYKEEPLRVNDEEEYVEEFSSFNGRTSISGGEYNKMPIHDINKKQLPNSYAIVPNVILPNKQPSIPTSSCTLQDILPSGPSTDTWKLEYDRLQHVLNHAGEDAKQAMFHGQHLNPGQVSVFCADQPLSTIAKLIQWNWPDLYGGEKFFVMLASFHAEQAFFSHRTIFMSDAVGPVW
ncbi:hypothetical protein FQR65_LT10435 [Abscondita terminalis]|nr:hypothetical protein FQR65_LT10435 [Abscondita terminalis]